MLHILVIADNSKSYKPFLNDNFKTYEAKDSAQGIKIYESNKIDCLLLDCFISKEDSLEILAKFKKSNPYVPIVMLTGQGEEKLTIEAMKSGAQEYLIKEEICFEKLNHAISNAVEKAKLQYELQQKTRELEISNQQLQKTLKELESTQQKIIYRERMSALGEMASGIAHDFNNSLSPIRGLTDLVLHMKPLYLKNEEKMRKYFELIEKSAIDAVEVVQRMRKFYLPKEEQHIPLDLNELIRDVKLFTKTRWQSQAQLEGKTIEFHHFLEKIPIMTGSESELKELMINLVFNSIDAILEKGEIHIQSYQKENKVILKVKDTGKGMSEEVRNCCFEPFFTTKDSRSSGLGLSVVYGIVQRHNAHIEIESTLKKGTVFTISFPLDENETFTPNKNILNVLVVDDQLQNQVLLSEILTAQGHNVETANDGAEALQKFSQQKFNLVITDMAMPNMKGDVLAAKIKQQNASVPVFMITGFGSSVTQKTSMETIDKILTKPLNIKELQEALTKIK